MLIGQRHGIRMFRAWVRRGNEQSKEANYVDGSVRPGGWRYREPGPSLFWLTELLVVEVTVRRIVYVCYFGLCKNVVGPEDWLKGPKIGGIWHYRIL